VILPLPGWQFLRLFVLSLFCLYSSAPARAEIRYSVSLEHPEQHLFRVTMTIPSVQGEVIVQMPAWNALYQVRDFSSHVRQVEAFVGEKLAAVRMLDKQTWQVDATGTVVVRYATYWDENGPFASQINSEHAFLNPAMLLLYVPERRGETVAVDFSDIPRNWEVATASRLLVVSGGGIRPIRLTADSYDAFVDGPIEFGVFQRFDLPGISPPVSVVVHGEGWNKKKIGEDFAKICQSELKLMGGAPYEHYTFILHIGRGYGGGGMEHANSTAIGVPSDEYLDGVAAHEFFHLWNVKRIRPASLEPVDYTKEQYTRALWFAEGVTSTYGSYTMLRSHLWTKQQFYDDLSQQITELESRPANHWQSAEQSSLDAWLEKYPLYNKPEYSVSYYTKGQILGVLLDLQIRQRSDGSKSLDDVLRYLNETFARTGTFYRDSLDIRLTAEKIVGGSFEDFFDQFVAHANPFPYSETLAMAGLELRKTEQRRATLGFAVERNPEGAFVVRTLEAESNAAAAGVRAGDVVTLWNKQEPPRRLDRWLRDQKPGDLVRIWVRRDGKQTEIEFRLGDASEVFYQVIEDGHASEKAKRLREAWLQGD
jgi:predicted metalloprotease with PDZ domain